MLMKYSGVPLERERALKIFGDENIGVGIVEIL